MPTNIVAEQTFDQKVAAVAAELADLVAEGVAVVVAAEDLVELEAAGFIVDLETGEILDVAVGGPLC